MALIGREMIELRSALLGRRRGTRGARVQAVDGGGEASGGGIGGRGQGVALLPVVTLEVVLQRTRLSAGVVAVGTFVRSLT